MRSVDWVAGLVKVDPRIGHSKGSAKARAQSASRSKTPAAVWAGPSSTGWTRDRAIPISRDEHAECKLNRGVVACWRDAMGRSAVQSFEPGGGATWRATAI